VFCGVGAPAERVVALEAAGIEVAQVAGEGGRLNLGVVLDVLGARQILSVLLECGPELNGAFLAQGLVDKVVLFYGETELGEDALPFAAGVGSPFLLEQSLRAVSRKTFGADACVAGYVRDPWR
jgi:diaminohydroxyphosphoribosylaminopyrimidine deaminase/5-amino-6-(5-phosphoribosylamino)uracil reductase